MAPRKEARARQRSTAQPKGGSPSKARGATAPRSAKPMQRRRHLFWKGVVGLAVLGVAFLGAFPARTYLRQQHSTDRAEAELSALDSEISTLQTEIDRLQTDDEVEARAREEYHMARPGEEAVALLPPVPAPVTIPSGWPYSRLFAATR